MNLPITRAIERRALLWVAAIALAGAGACESKLQPDGGPGAGGSSAGGASASSRGGAPGDAGVCPSNETLFCLPGSGATVDYCGDFLMAATCSGGQWVCPPGTGVPTRCRCPGLNPGMCVCTSDGWQCGGGGAGAGGTSGAGGYGGYAGTGGAVGAGGSAGGSTGVDCSHPQQYCGVASPTCSSGMPATCEANVWVCPPGTVNITSCLCPTLLPGCFCTSLGARCGDGGSPGRGGTGGKGGGAGTVGGGGGSSGGADGGAGGTGGACSAVTTLEACDARSDCHSVFTDPHNCACLALGCCARFSRCADGDCARCAETQTVCDALTPYCESPYTVSYTQTCYEGCVRTTECGPVP